MEAAQKGNLPKLIRMTEFNDNANDDGNFLSATCDWYLTLNSV